MAGCASEGWWLEWLAGWSGVAPGDFSGDAWIGPAQVPLCCKKISLAGALTRVEAPCVASGCSGEGWEERGIVEREKTLNAER